MKELSEFMDSLYEMCLEAVFTGVFWAIGILIVLVALRMAGVDI